MIFSSDMRASCSSVCADAARQEEKGSAKERQRGWRRTEKGVDRDGTKGGDTLREEIVFSACAFGHTCPQNGSSMILAPNTHHRKHLEKKVLQPGSTKTW